MTARRVRNAGTIRLCAAIATLLLTTAATVGGHSDLQPELRGLLSNALKFSPSELADLESGKVAAHRLGATAAGEAGAAGAVRIKGRKEAFIDLYRDIVRFKRGPVSWRSACSPIHRRSLISRRCPSTLRT